MYNSKSKHAEEFICDEEILGQHRRGQTKGDGQSGHPRHFGTRGGIQRA